MGKRLRRYKREGMGGCLKGLQSRLTWMDELCPQKGGSNAVDDFCHTDSSVAAGAGEWLHHGEFYSYPASHRHCHRPGQNHPGARTHLSVSILVTT